ncbi:MAG: DUF393 domain-containing protein [Candidatus Omnitrophica bacterium]|nr:DUF393 domain-containing protein [Candidatus Omnitrophota bacterium]
MAYKHLVTQEPWAIGMTQVGALSVFLALFYAAALNFSAVRTSIVLFFTEKTSPINLAMFRIFFFGYLFITSHSKEVLWYSQFPQVLKVAPLGMKGLLPLLPINLTFVAVAFALFKTFCFLSLVGWQTRISTIAAAVTGFYILGIPEFYGSVSHYHHLFWFLTIFAASRCSDALSVDAVIRNFRNARQNKSLDLPEPSITYSLPLRFIWILMGIAYFFPGFWKLWSSGNAWIFGDNMLRHMQLVWISFDWLPIVRIDHWPWLCRVAGAGAIIFEISFLFMIFSRRLRYFAAAQGFLFHNFTNLLMRIDFYELQVCYAAFVNWAKFFQWAGRKLFSQNMLVLYDGHCSFCRRTIGFLKVFDVFGRIEYIDLHSSASQDYRKNLKIDQEDLMKDIHGLIGTKIVRGFSVYQNIAGRVPLLWIAYPLMQIGIFHKMGEKIYGNVAAHRTCKLPERKVVSSPNHIISTAILVSLAAILIAGNLTLGFCKIGSGWPFACYPTFSEIAWDRLRTISCEITYPNGNTETVHFQFVKEYTGLYKVVGMVSKIYDTKDLEARDKKFRALWDVFSQTNPELKNASRVRFYFLENYSDPAKWHLNPINKTLAIEFEPNHS